MSQMSSDLSRKSNAVNLPNPYWIGFDLGGTKMLCVVLDSQFQVVARNRKKTKGFEGAALGLERMAELIEETLAEKGIHRDQVAGIGVGCPGPVDWSKGIVTVAVNLGWNNVPVGDFLQRRFQCPVEVLNDVDAGVYGEYRFGAAVGAYATVGIFPGTGIGGGCVHDGKILRGRRLTVMEIGHMKISSSTRTSGIAMAGTLEAEASRLHIAAECAKLAYRGEAPELNECAGTDISRIRSKALAVAIKGGDRAVERVVRQSAQQIGYAVTNIVHLLGPDIIILGGGLVEALPDLYLEEVQNVSRRCVLPCYADMFQVRVAKLGDDAGAMGAAAYVASIVQA